MMKHRISAGALVLRGEELLLVRHKVEGKYDFWAPPGGGAEDNEELAAAAEREAFEEAGIRAKALGLAYIDELIDDSGRMVKFWFVAEYISGDLNVRANPAAEESIVAAGWFGKDQLPEEFVFPSLLRDAFWTDLQQGFKHPRKLPLKHSVF